MSRPQQINYAVGTGDLSAELDFVCQSLIIDNATNQWLHILSADRYCPPNTSGLTIQIKSTRIAQVRFEAPPGESLAPTIAGQAATLSYSQDRLTEASGVSLVSSPPSRGEIFLFAANMGPLGIGNTDIITYSFINGFGSNPSGSFFISPTTPFPLPPGVRSLLISLAKNLNPYGLSSAFTKLRVRLNMTAGLYVNLFDSENGDTIPIEGYLALPLPQIGAITMEIAYTAKIASPGYLFVSATTDIKHVEATILNPIMSPASGSVWDISDRTTRAVGQISPRPYDGQAVAVPGVGVQATVTLTGVAGKKWMIHHLIASIEAFAAVAANGTYPLINDGATTIWAVVIGTQAIIGYTSTITLTDGAITCSTGASITAGFNTPQANNLESISIGAYLN